MVQRQHLRHGKHRARQLLGRKEHSRDHGHRRHDERHVEAEEVPVLREHRHDEADRGEGKPDQERDGQRHDDDRRGREAEGRRDGEDGGAGKPGLARRPDDLAGDHIVDGERCVEDRIPGLLAMHARETGEHRFERGGEHGGRTKRAGSEERHVRHPGDRRQQRAKAVAQAEEHDQRVGEVGQHRGDEELAPDEEITLPDGEPAHG